MPEKNRSDVSVIGLGAMGQALGRALLGAGYTTTVWNRTASKAGDLVAQGAVLADSVRSAAEASPLIIICVLDYEAANEVLTELEAAELRDRVVINLTTGSPTEARDTASRARTRGYLYLDGGIMATPEMIGVEGAFVLYSGEAHAAFKENRALLEAFGEARYVGADAGLASLFDLALLGAMYGMYGGALHAIAVVGTEGVTAQDFTAEHLMPFLAAMVGGLTQSARQIDTRDYTSDASAGLAMQQVGFRTIVRATRDQGVSPELLEPIQSLIDRRVAAGFDKDDVSGIVELLVPR